MLKFTAGTYKPIVHTRRRTVLRIANSSSKEWMQKAVRHVKSRKHILFFLGRFRTRVKMAAVRESLCEVGEKNSMYNSLKNCEC